jgi:hypothetical protein
MTQLYNDFEQTKKYLSQTPRVHFECAICIVEQRTSPQQRATCQETLKLVVALRNAADQSLNGHTTKAKLDSITKRGIRLVNKLSATYDDNIFKDGMP